MGCRRAVASDQSFHFPPISNGMDFLNSAVGQLVDGEEDHSLKYAVLHLQAAVEILFKVRLVDEHWSLVFKNPGAADRESYERGDFESCGTDATIERLQKIVGVDVPEKARSRLKKLARYRNQLQHYGANRESAHAVKAVAAEVLDFLLVFLEDWLGPSPESEEFDKYHEILEDVRENLTSIEVLVALRLKRIERELEVVGIERVTGCLSCGCWTLVFDALEFATCRFCQRTWMNLSLLPRGESFPRRVEDALSHCTECGEPTFLLEMEEDGLYNSRGRSAEYEEPVKMRRFEVCVKCWEMIFDSGHRTPLHRGAKRSSD